MGADSACQQSRVNWKKDCVVSTAGFDQLRHWLVIAMGYPLAGFRPYQALIRVDRMPCPELGASMRRREFICLVGGVAALPLAARAQQSSKIERIAMVHPAEKVGNMTINGRPGFRAFFEELNRLGYVEGQNLIVERYSAEGRIDYFFNWLVM